jgi:hypothetical protein
MTCVNNPGLFSPVNWVKIAFKWDGIACRSWNRYLSQYNDTQFYRRDRKLDRSSTDQHLRMLCSYENIMRSNYFCGHHILTEGVFVTQLSCNTGISVWRIVWVTTNCCFVSDTLDVIHTPCSIRVCKIRVPTNAHKKYIEIILCI